MAAGPRSRSEVRFRVRYAETDQMGIVHHANYLVWMEVARTELCRQQGISYREMEERSGLHLVVAEVRCRYLHPARYDDEILASAWLESAHPRMVEFAYEIRRAADGVLLATGATKHVFVKDGKPVKIPEEFRCIFGLS
ncbi:MAG: acyl-CoA thioesterase [Bryobacteraceae bacterium]|nr:acyl-CoA thioesterase [Bryobacteraceae bacterium]MCX7603611.1 acyl-CoA thioesterase [Bryobacteraceae bacterium]